MESYLPAEVLKPSSRVSGRLHQWSQNKTTTLTTDFCASHAVLLRTASMRESLWQLISLLNFFTAAPVYVKPSSRWSVWRISPLMAFQDFLLSIHPPPPLTDLPSSPGQSSAGQTRRITNCTVTENQITCVKLHKVCQRGKNNKTKKVFFWC